MCTEQINIFELLNRKGLNSALFQLDNVLLKLEAELSDHIK